MSSGPPVAELFENLSLTIRVQGHGRSRVKITVGITTYAVFEIWPWNPSSRSYLKVTYMKWVQLPIDSHRFRYRCRIALPNYADPVYGVATICHQVRCLRWGQPSLFHTAMSLLIWYKMFCMRDISYRLIWMKYINMLSVYAQSGTHRPVNWWIIAVFT